MHQPRILEADVDESPEVDHIQDRPLELHARDQVFDLQDPLLEDRLGQVVSRVALGATERFDDVSQGEFADLQLARQLEHIGLRQFFVELG